MDIKHICNEEGSRVTGFGGQVLRIDLFFIIFIDSVCPVDAAVYYNI